ncbi:MAG: hypothetical protein HKN16_06610, partial [Saprospiraceae bacterium]|nr:hypothetical protein [Saprospiraceae bacterium]
MKKWIWIPVFLFVLFAGDRVGGWVLESLLMKADFRYSRMYDEDHKGANLLLVGNSRGLMFFQPEIEKLTSKTTMNLSYNGLPMQMGEVLIKDYLDKFPNTKNLVLEVTMADRLNVPLVSGFNAYSSHSKRVRDIIKENSVNSYYGAILSHLFKYNSEIFQRGIS